MSPGTAAWMSGFGPAGNDRLHLPVNLLIDGQAYVKRVMAGRADEKPSGHVIIPLKHGMKPIPVPTGGTISEFFLHFDSDNLIGHGSVSTLGLKGSAGGVLSGRTGIMHHELEVSVRTVLTTDLSEYSIFSD